MLAVARGRQAVVQHLSRAVHGPGCRDHATLHWCYGQVHRLQLGMHHWAGLSIAQRIVCSDKGLLLKPHHRCQIGLEPHCVLDELSQLLVDERLLLLE